MMKRMGRVGSIPGRVREMCRMEADELDVETEDSGGMYTPLSRKDLMFDMRRIADAEGERRMIGSGRRAGVLGFMAIEGLLAMFVAAGC